MTVLQDRGTDATRQAAYLFTGFGVLAALSAAVPPYTDQRTAIIGIVAFNIAIAVGLVLLPWQHMPPNRSLVAVVPAFLAIGASNAAGLLPIRGYGAMFVLVFAWLGLHHPPGSALRLLVVFLPSYVVPLVVARGDPAVDVRAVALVAITSVIVAEAIARGRHATAAAEKQAAALARAFRTVARTSASLQQLDPQAVLDTVVDGVMAIGFDGANLVIIDVATNTFTLEHTRGLATELGTARHSAELGMTGIARRTKEVLVVEDYSRWEHALPYYRELGVATVIAVPILVGDVLAAVLVATTSTARPVAPSDIEPLQALADVAGAVLANVERYQQEQSTAIEQTQAANTDELTGLPNRRRADQELFTIRPETSVVMIDLDHFRAVNERLGHAGGDEVLRAISAHLSAELRDEDFLARIGGEELLLLLPHRDVADAVAVVDRLSASWRETRPATTFSAGVACHLGGDVAHTIARADAALYEAKRGGRDQCRAEAFSPG